MPGKLEITSYFSLVPELWADRAGLRALGGEIQFGFESEFSEIEPLLEFYGPAEGLGISLETPRITALRVATLCSNLDHGDHRAILVKRGGPDFLPRELFRDDTGNVELIMPPRASLAQFWEEVSWINAHLGVGSLQAMVSLPRDAFFAAGMGHLGYLNFFNELDTLEKLAAGHAKAQTGKLPGNNFLHPYLGPMTELRHRPLRKYYVENARGNLLSGEAIERISRREHSFKFVGGTAYRPDIAAPNKICFEVRDAHRSPERLRERLARILYFWRRERELNSLNRFAGGPAFDSGISFSALDSARQALLIRACGIQIPARVLGHAKPTFAYEVFRNFAYPLRNWAPWLELLGEGNNERVDSAQRRYLAGLDQASGLGDGKAREAIQRSLGEFAEESGLVELFRAEEMRILRMNHG
ncbi:MAG: hypothetical protein EOP11_05755 [Proteobacteria bacterium]|nr:MAG: hypothetical protein EOP11_05755 [Pseudomonadota bacterium]